MFLIKLELQNVFKIRLILLNYLESAAPFILKPFVIIKELFSIHDDFKFEDFVEKVKQSGRSFVDGI